jgi:nucleoid-associated protein YgaU
VNDLKAQAQAAIDDGRYGDAVELSQQADAKAQEAEQYAEQRVLAYRANGWINRARERMAVVKTWDVEDRYPQEYALATGHLEDAEAYFSAGQWSDTINAARLMMSALEDVTRPPLVVQQPEPEPETQAEPEPEPQVEPSPALQPVTVAGPVLPRYYIVRLIPDRRDCFWRIAEYDFVYGDPWKWPILYQANKSKIPDIDNPDLIEPGTVIEIPSIAGERREGTWDPDAQ